MFPSRLGIATLPTELVQTGATVEFSSIELGVWSLRLDDGRLFTSLGGLPEACRSEGLRVTITAKLRIDVPGGMASPLELLQIESAPTPRCDI